MPQRAKHWAVVNTHAHRERFAIEHLKRQGCEAYCPVMRTTIRHARRTRVVLRPLFRGYIFVKVDAANPCWRAISLTSGVRSIVRSASGFGRLPGSFVDALKAREVDGAIARPESPFQVGQTVALTDGPFDGIVATIVDMNHRDRLVVLINLMNRLVEVKVDSAQVRETLHSDH
jgi:transcriptional antiterminator RfaH